MVKRQLPKLELWVRFPSSAPRLPDGKRLSNKSEKRLVENLKIQNRRKPEVKNPVCAWGCFKTASICARKLQYEKR